MKISRILKGILLLAIYTLFSCIKSSDEFPYAGTAIAIHTSISATNPAGKASIGEDGSGYFENGDIISIKAQSRERPDHSVFKNMKLEGNEWTPGIEWKEIGSSHAILASVYPARTDMQETFIHTISAEQNIKKEYISSDILGAVTEARNGTPAELKFTHLMSRMKITLTTDGTISPQELASATVRLSSKPSAKIHCLKDGKPAISAVESFGEEITINTQNSGTGVFYAIVCPQEVPVHWKASGWIEITVCGKTSFLKAPEKLQSGTPFTNIESGKEIDITISLKKEGENWAGETFWTKGINNPTVNNWGYAYVTPQKTLGLKWDKTYGWYDCNKVEPNRPGKDSELCWAATAANMIYWWMDRNRENIRKFGKYTGPSGYINSFDCEIFEYYKSHFFNEGNDLAAALSWFFTGRYGTGTKPEGGFFKDVLGSGAVTEITRFGDMSFSDAMKKAFLSGYATGCVIEFPNRYLHAISVWGADFDQDGEVSAIYITDSNDRDLEDQWEGNVSGLDRPITKVGLIRKAVQKKTDGYYYMESSSPGYFTFKIIELYFLGTKQAEWDQYFQKHPDNL